MPDVTEYRNTVFESLKQINEHGMEYWSARDLSTALQYTAWRNFVKVITKAMTACNASGINMFDHFVDVNKMVSLGSGSERALADYQLSRYACYLIVQNADSSKEIIALGQTYFALKTRERELEEEFQQLTEDKKRLAIRNELKEHNRKLADAARNAGVRDGLDYAIFQNHGYKGLYGGMTAKDIHTHKGLKKKEKILDHMGSTELAANLFRATQTEDKLRRENIKGKQRANQTHYEVGKKVRQTIAELGGAMPEDLPVPEQSIQQLEKDDNSKLTE